MKVLFVTPYLHQDIGVKEFDLSNAWRNPPFNVVSLASWLNKHGHESRIADLQRELIRARGDTAACLDSLRNCIQAFMPDIIAFSFFSAQTPEIADISIRTREICGVLGIAPVCIAGGIHPTIEPEAALRELDVDYVCIGEGERPLLAMADGESPDAIPGIASLSRLNSGRAPVVQDLDSLPFPDYTLCDWRLYATPTHLRVKAYRTGTLDIMLGRGCAFACNFCAYRALSPVRFHSAGYFLDMVNAVNKNTGVTDFYIIDSTLGSNRKLLVEVCEKAISGGFPEKYRFLGNMRADQVDRELLALMRRAGFIYLFYGFESGSQSDLDRINKKTKVSDNYAAAMLHKKLDFLYNASMLVNYPGQTVSDLRETEKFLLDVRPPSVGINMYAPLPGCSDYDALKSDFFLPNGRQDWHAIGQAAFTRVFASMTKSELLYWKDRLEGIALMLNASAKSDDSVTGNGVDFPIERLRDKWREVPATRQGRIFSSDAMRMSDSQLLAWWEKCREETCVPGIRGWYQDLYKDVFREKTIADIGPGIGLDGIFFIENGANVTFVDIHRDNLALLERICRLKKLEAEFYYIDDFEKYDFPHAFDAFLMIGSLIHAPFDFTRKQVGALVPFLKPGGMVLWLGYPYERFVASGARTGEEFAKMTDGERTPWAEWYDKAKIERLFGNDFVVPLEMNFGADQIEFNVFQLNRADNSSLPETERAAFPQHSIPSLQHIRQMMTEPGNAGESISSNVVLLRNAEGEFGGYEYATYAEVRNSGKPVIGDDLVFSYATIRDHATIPFFPIPSGIRGINDQEKRHFLLELHFPSIADVSCQWTIQIQDDSYATLAALSPPHLTVEHAGCRRMRVPFVIEDAGVSEIRIVFCPEVRAGEGVLPSRICVREMTFFEKAPPSAPEMEIPPFPQRLHGALRHVGQDVLGTFLGERLPGTRWEDSANLPLPPAYDDMCDVRILRYLFRNFRPNRHLEFGTWKGNGVRRVLEECGNASVWTVNLWEGEDRPDGTWAYGENYKDEDIAVVGAEFEGEYIRTDAGVMIGIEYLKAGLGSRVSQIYSDSRLWNDSAYPDGFFDSVFVDGGHDADTARSDVQKALRLLRPGGLLLLHDFCPRPEEYSRFPNTVGITNMVAEEIGNIAMMCSDFFWIEDTWLFCGIRGNLTKNL